MPKLAIFFLMFLTVMPLWGAPLWSQLQSEWRICIPANADAVEVYAAEELAKYLQLASQCRFPIIRSDEAPTANAIIIGTPATMPNIHANRTALGLADGGDQRIAVQTLNDNLYLAGNGRHGVLPAVYTFLHEVLGVRWFWPASEPDGEFVPAREFLALPSLAIHYEPPIRYRGYHFINGTNPELEQWLARNCGNMIRDGRSGGAERIDQRYSYGFYNHFSGHNIDPGYLMEDVEAYYSEHPSWFAWANGRRVKTQFCWNNPEVDAFLVSRIGELVDATPRLDMMGFYPTDDQDYCTCADCMANDTATNWFQLLRRLIPELRKKYPDLQFTTIAYQGYMDFPKCPVSEYEFVEFAPYGRCFIHKMQDDCHVNANIRKVWDTWLDSGVPTGVYGYEFDVFTPIMTIPFYSWLGEQAQFFQRRGVIAHLPEIHGTWGGKDGHQRIAMRLAFYLCTRLMWQPDADVNTLIREFCAYVYPAGQEEMFAYHTALDRFWSGQQRHLTSYFNAPIYTVEEFFQNNRIDDLMNLLRQASAKCAANPDEAGRMREQNAIDFENAALSGWIRYYWMIGDDILNVPAQEALELHVGSARLECVWQPDGLTFRILDSDADAVDGEAMAPDGTRQTVACPLTGGKGELRFPGEFDPATTLQLKLRLLKNGEVSATRGVDAPWVALMSRWPDTAKSVAVSAPDSPMALGNVPKLRTSLLAAGWQAAVCGDAEKFAALNLNDFDVVGIRVSGNRLPEAFYRRNVVDFARNGGLVILSADTDIDFEQLLGIPGSRLRWTGRQQFEWRLRKTQWLKAGAWLTAPDDLKTALDTYCTPEYGYEIPADSPWEEWGRMRKADGSMASYLLRMPVGDGEIFLLSGPLGLDNDGAWMITGSSHHDSVTALLNNLYHNR